MSQSVSLSALIWSVADLLRGDYKPSEYGRVILPFTVLRRLDCVLAPTKAAVLAEKAAKEPLGIDAEPFLLRVAKLGFVNTSPFDLKTLMGDQDNLLATALSASASQSRGIGWARPGGSTRALSGFRRFRCTPTRSATTTWASPSRS